MTFMYPNLKVYIDRKRVIYLPDKIDRNKSHLVSFYVSLDDIGAHMGKIIERVIKDIGNNVLDFALLPVPRCLFKSNYPMEVKMRMKDEPVKFLMDGHEFRFFYDDEIGPLRKRLKLFHVCSGCEFRVQGKCEGIFGIKSDSTRNEKTKQWLFDEIPRSGQIRLLDLGCGVTPFLKLYEKSAKKNNSSFYCVDPSGIYIKLMNEKIPVGLKSNIMASTGTGEMLTFESSMFDVVLLHYSYSHFMDIEKTIKNINRVLKKGGELVIFEAYHPNENLPSEVKTKKELSGDAILDRTEFREHGLHDAIGILEANCFEIADSFESKTKERVSWGIKARKT